MMSPLELLLLILLTILAVPVCVLAGMELWWKSRILMGHPPSMPGFPVYFSAAVFSTMTVPLAVLLSLGLIFVKRFNPRTKIVAGSILALVVVSYVVGVRLEP